MPLIGFSLFIDVTGFYWLPLIIFATPPVIQSTLLISLAAFFRAFHAATLPPDYVIAFFSSLLLLSPLIISPPFSFLFAIFFLLIFAFRDAFFAYERWLRHYCWWYAYCRLLSFHRLFSIFSFRLFLVSFRYTPSLFAAISPLLIAAAELRWWHFHYFAASHYEPLPFRLSRFRRRRHYADFHYFRWAFFFCWFRLPLSITLSLLFSPFASLLMLLLMPLDIIWLLSRYLFSAITLILHCHWLASLIILPLFLMIISLMLPSLPLIRFRHFFDYAILYPIDYAAFDIIAAIRCQIFIADFADADSHAYAAATPDYACRLIPPPPMPPATRRLMPLHADVITPRRLLIFRHYWWFSTFTDFFFDAFHAAISLRWYVMPSSDWFYCRHFDAAFHIILMPLILLITLTWALRLLRDATYADAFIILLIIDAFRRSLIFLLFRLLSFSPLRLSLMLYSFRRADFFAAAAMLIDLRSFASLLMLHVSDTPLRRLPPIIFDDRTCRHYYYFRHCRCLLRHDIVMLLPLFLRDTLRQPPLRHYAIFFQLIAIIIADDSITPFRCFYLFSSFLSRLLFFRHFRHADAIIFLFAFIDWCFHYWSADITLSLHFLAISPRCHCHLLRWWWLFSRYFLFAAIYFRHAITPLSLR